MSALAIGLILSLWIAQNTPSVKELIAKKVIEIVQKEWNIHASVDSTKINLFTLSILLKNGTILPADDRHFGWKFDACNIHVSPINLILKKKVSLYLTFNNVKVYTAYQNKQADFINHLYDMFKQKDPSIKISPKALTINNADIIVNLPEQNNKKIVLHLPGRLHLSKEKSFFKKPNCNWVGSYALTDALIAFDNNAVITHLNGNVSCYKNKKENQWYFSTAIQTNCPLLNPKMAYNINGSWDNNEKNLTLSDIANTLHMAISMHNDQLIDVKGELPLPLIQRAATAIANGLKVQLAPTTSLEGACNVDLALHMNKNTIDTNGIVKFTDLKIANIPLQAITLNLSNDDHQRTVSDVAIIQSPNTHVSGALSWDWENKTGSLTLTNTGILSPSLTNAQGQLAMAINPHDLSLDLSFNDQGMVKGNYRCAITNQTTERRLAYHGVLMLCDNVVGLKGASRHGEYTIKAALTPTPHVINWNYRIGNKDYINLSASPNNNDLLQGTVRWAFIRSFLDQKVRRFVFNNNCVFDVSLNQHALPNISGSLALSSGRFFVPDFHNLIQGVKFNAAFDAQHKKITLDNVNIVMSKGAITSPRATIALTDDYEIESIHAPLSVENMFINWKRDFYGFAYGNILLNKVPKSYPELSGIIVLKKSLLKDTFFTSEQQATDNPTMKGLIGPLELPIGLNIKLVTERPIKANTPTIETAASLDLVIKNTPRKDYVSAPTLNGTITLDDGCIKFLRNRLRIDYGKIQFVSNQSNDPLIDLIAKNRIGKYLITLQATGSLQKPNLLLESTPDLTEEQILGLLLSGSENVTLQADLPAMVLQNLDTLIFDSRKTAKNASWLDKISKTFKYVQITPNLTDDANQGKLKGSISVNLTDQLRAQIQKNLDLQKDFSAQLEYMISDDINVKVVKDQRGELGSEVEMRLKLG
jgi:hypothetical protein